MIGCEKTLAHVMKSTKIAIGGLTRHFERYKKENGEYIQFSNQEIDISRTHLNYNLATHQNLSQLEFIKKRTSEVHCPNRKELNVMCNWLVTKPKDIEPGEQERFFEETYKFLQNRYGKDNVISSYVHLDETTPHMHFAFIPIIYDKKKEYYKVCAKEVVNRVDLKTFHTDLSKSMASIFKRRISILNEATEHGNKSVLGLKQETYLKKSKEIDKKIKKIEDMNDALNNYDINYKDKKPGLLKKVSLTEEEYNKLILKAKLGERVDFYREENQEVNKIKDKLSDTLKKYDDIVKKYNSLVSNIKHLKNENSVLKENMDKFFNRPDETLERVNEVLGELEKIDKPSAIAFSEKWNEIKEMQKELESNDIGFDMDL